MSTTILLLDEEQKMFKAINRLVRPLDAVLLATGSIERALQFCKDQEVQVVIADLNREDADVNQFLIAAADINPKMRKIVLTSYADLEPTIAAINDGKINRYFTKPWDVDELREAIVEELDTYHAQVQDAQEKRVLGRLNEKMGEKVDFTSKLLDGTTELLSASRFRTSINIHAALLEQRLPGSSQFAKQTAKTAGRIATYLGLSLKEREQIMLAAELHQIGLLGLSDKVLHGDPDTWTDADEAAFTAYPAVGADALMEDGEENAVSLMVRHHREDNDGGGFPLQLVAQYIPIGARIIRVAADFESGASEMGASVAMLEMLKDNGELYDPEVLAALTETKLNPGAVASPDNANEVTQWQS